MHSCLQPMVWRAPVLLGPDPGLHFPPPREAPLGPPLQSQEWWPDGASWGRVDQLWPRSSPKGSPYYAALWPHLPVGTWGTWITGTQSGEDQLSWAFLLPFSFYLPQGFYFYFCVHFFQVLDLCHPHPTSFVFIIFTFSSDLYIWLCYTQVR